ncbi:MAG: hypothetical protein K9H48_20970 [Melioribacteraceae bacterium]|nr:hypothetical protein [Melioribacteraceae bacterium]MCF8396321.1 hypothetical protein [Melioribacteraceae bacterium]
MPKIIENRLIEEFKDRESFSRNELFEFFKYFEPDLKEGTFGWRIYDLKNKNIIKPLMRGLYTISYKSKYKPEASQDLLKLARKINDRFEDIKYCIWETSWLNEFSQHQSSKKIILIEVEKDFLDSFFYELKEIYKGDVYLTPDEKAINFYVAESIQPIVIKKLVTRSPITKRTEKKLKFYTPYLEKILVDIFTEDKLFYYSQGSELVHIFENALKGYSLNYTKLFSYAKRRERDIDIKMFLSNNLRYLVKDIIDV